ncbi:MAG: 4-hydroxy-tetrahydrodipicolinate reductase [Gemmatimonadales bacterium]
MTALPIALIGLGRMGRAVEQLAPERGFEVVARLAKAGSGARAITSDLLRGAAVAIEFTTSSAAAENARACIAAGCPIVVGTTGWYDQLPSLRAEATRLGGALLTAPNFSVGVVLFDRVVAEAARLFAAVPGFDVHLIDIHHSAKTDAPSGTASMLAATAGKATGIAVPISSVRTGSVPGTHELIFDAPFEQVRLVHEARDRRVFAEGALLAARWLVGRRGAYTMNDVIDAFNSTSLPRRP